jgi:hypothetical protein
MVGNDPVNEMITAKTGMKTFPLVDEGSFDRPSLALNLQFTAAATDDAPVCDHQGPLSEVAAVVNNYL